MASSMPVGAVAHVAYNGGGKPRQYAGVNLFVKNLDATFDDQRLWELFSKFGLIISCKVQVDANGISKGFGFVCFTNVNEASLAIAELNGRVVGTKPLYVNVFESKEERAKNRLKKAVEYSEFSADTVKPATYEEFLQLSMVRGRGRGRGRASDPGMLAPPSPELPSGMGRAITARATFSPPRARMLPNSPELPLGTGRAIAPRAPFSPPRARMLPNSSELLLGAGLVNTMAAHTPFSPPRAQIPPSYSSVGAATGAAPAAKSAFQVAAKPTEEEQQLPSDETHLMAQFAASFLHKFDTPKREVHPIYEPAYSSPDPGATVALRGGAGDPGASTSRYASVEYISPFVYRASSASTSPAYTTAAYPDGAVQMDQ